MALDRKRQGVHRAAGQVRHVERLERGYRPGLDVDGGGGGIGERVLVQARGRGGRRLLLLLLLREVLNIFVLFRTQRGARDSH